MAQRGQNGQYGQNGYLGVKRGQNGQKGVKKAHFSKGLFEGPNRPSQGVKMAIMGHPTSNHLRVH